MSTRRNKRSTQILAELYDAGIELHINPESGKLRASHVTQDGLTEEERAIIQRHKDALKGLVTWNIEIACNISHKMLELVWGGFSDAMERERDAVRKAVEEDENMFCEACEAEDMGRARWAARNFVRDGRKKRAEVEALRQPQEQLIA